MQFNELYNYQNHPVFLLTFSINRPLRTQKFHMQPILTENTGRSTEALVVDGNEIGLEVNTDKQSTWIYLEIRMQDEVEILKLVVVPLKRRHSSNIW
jgi:hypothetical protein